MNTMQRIKIQIFAPAIGMIAVLAGCDQDRQTVESAENQAPVSQLAVDQRPLLHVLELDDYTLRANVSPSNFLPDAMAEQYGIEPDDGVVLLNLVVLENRADLQPVPVAAEVSAQHETLIGHAEVIHMRAIETDGYVSYIGTFDASTQRFFQIVIEAQPEGTDQPLQMSFEVRLEAFESAALK